jgi:hypothetical protein
MAMRRATLVCTILAALIGWLALVYDLYGPTYSTGTCDINGHCSTGTASLVSVGLTPTALVFILSIAFLLLLAVIASFLIYTNRRSGLALLIACLVVLLVATAISGFSIGYSFLPSDLLLILATVFATRRQHAPPVPPPSAPPG